MRVMRRRDVAKTPLVAVRDDGGRAHASVAAAAAPPSTSTPHQGSRWFDSFCAQRTIHRFRNHYPLSSHQLSRVPVRSNVDVVANVSYSAAAALIGVNVLFTNLSS